MYPILQLNKCTIRSLTTPHGALPLLSQQAPLPSILDPPTKALSCIVPAYNEEDRLPGTLDEALA